MPEPARSRTLEAQEEILSRSGSGYGREQVVRMALSLAVEEVLKQTRLLGRETGEDVDGLVLDYLTMAEALLSEAGTEAGVGWGTEGDTEDA